MSMTNAIRTRARSNRRGVSPIIATILLVAITVVLAAVLYILVTGLIGGSHSVTSSIGLSTGTTVQCATTAAGTPASTTFNDYPMTIASTTATITTANFGLQLTLSGATVNTAAGTTNTAGPGTCPGANPSAAAAWIAVLTSPTGGNLATYSSAGWVALGANTLPITISSGQTISVLDTAAIDSATLSAFGAGGASVTGQAVLP